MQESQGDKTPESSPGKVAVPMTVAPHFRLAKVMKMVFLAEALAPGQSGPGIVCDSVTSDYEMFYKYMAGFSGYVLGPAGISVNSVCQFLAILHKDETASIFVNQVPVALAIRAKRGLKAGERVGYNALADITGIRFVGIQFAHTDSIIYCFKVNWKFGLYFDLRPQASKNPSFDSREASLAIASQYRRLAFQEVYDALESDRCFASMIQDGWFPFIELLGGEFEELVIFYQQSLDVAQKSLALSRTFDVERLKHITERWWGHPLYDEKRAILEAGTQAFTQATPHGDICCIKTLLPEIEGILRLLLYADKGEDTRKQERWFAHLEEKARSKAHNAESLLIPGHFVHYLENVIFPSFNLASGTLSLSRHTAAHGLASPDLYTRVRALQVILVLDQLRFCL